MRNMKKVLSLVLVTMMMLACVPLTALPAVAAVADTDVAKIGDTGYATFEAALDAAVDGDTIELLKDATTDGYACADARNITVKGNKNTLSVTGKFQMNDCNVTFTDTVITMTASFESSTGKTGDLTFDGCTVTAASNCNDIFRLCGAGDFIFVDTTVTSAAANPVFFVRPTVTDDYKHTLDDAGAVNVKLTRSTITKTGHGANANGSNGNIVSVRGGNTEEVRDNMVLNFILEESSALISAANVSTTYGYSIFRLENALTNDLASGGLLTITGDATSKLSLAPTVKSTYAGSAQCNYVCKGGSSAVTTHLYGAFKMEANANITNGGTLYVPYFALTATYGTEQEIGWNFTIDGDSTTYKVTSGTDNVPGLVTAGALPATANTSAVSFSLFAALSYTMEAGETLESAISKISSGGTIYLSENLNQTTNYTAKKDFTIDGSDKYTFNTSAQIFTGAYSVTFANMTLKQTTGKLSANNANGVMTFSNVDLTRTAGEIRIEDAGGTLQFLNKTYYNSNAASVGIYVRPSNSANGTRMIVVDNSTLEQTKGHATQVQNASLIHLNQGTTANNCNFDIHLRNGAILKNSCTASNATGLIALQTASSYANTCVTTITTDDDVQLISNASGSVTTANFIVKNFSTTTNTVNLIGTPTFVIENATGTGTDSNGNSTTTKTVFNFPHVDTHTSADGSVTYTGALKTADGLYYYETVTDDGHTTATSFTPGAARTLVPAEPVTAENADLMVETSTGVYKYYEGGQTYEAAYDAYTAANHTVYVLDDITFTKSGNFFSGFGHWMSADTTAEMPATFVGVTKADGTKPAISGTFTYLGTRYYVFQNLELRPSDSADIDTDSSVKPGAITFNNCDFYTSRNIRITNNATVTFNESNIYSTPTGDNGLFYIRNQTATNSSGVEYDNYGDKDGCTLNIHNTYIRYTSASENNEAAPITFSGNTTGAYHATVNITGTSVIEDNGTRDNAHLISCSEQPAGGTINIDDTVTLFLNPTADNPDANNWPEFIFVNLSDLTGAYTLTGNPTYKMNAIAAAHDQVSVIYDTKGQLTVNNAADGLGYTVVGETSGELTLYKNDTFTITEPDEVYVINALYKSDLNFSTIGASIRTKDSEPGIRFATQISKEAMELLGDKITLGTLIWKTGTTPTLSDVATADADEATKNAGAQNVVSTKKFGENAADDTTYLYYAAMSFVDIPSNDQLYKVFGYDFVACGYYTLDYADVTDEADKTIYTKAITRSMKTVAEGTTRTDDNGAVLDYIISNAQ